jgi:hypothetical protein
MLFELPDDIPSTDLDAPEFENAGRVHDWRNHVPEERD